jgi:hypothetical protein
MSLASLYFRGGDFSLKWKGHFSFWCSAQKFLGRWRGEREFRHAVASTPAKLTEHLQVLASSRFRSRSVVPPSHFPRIHAFLFAAVFEFFLEWRGESESLFQIVLNTKYVVKYNYGQGRNSTKNQRTGVNNV